MEGRREEGGEEVENIDENLFYTALYLNLPEETGDSNEKVPVESALLAQVASPQSQMSSPGGPKPVKFDLSAGPPQVNDAMVLN